MPLNKIGNEYAELLGPLYEQTPKAVLAALAVSALVQASGDDNFDAVERLLLSEWYKLHQNGIVPQKPPLSNNPYRRRARRERRQDSS